MLWPVLPLTAMMDVLTYSMLVRSLMGSPMAINRYFLIKPTYLPKSANI